MAVYSVEADLIFHGREGENELIHLDGQRNWLIFQRYHLHVIRWLTFSRLSWHEQIDTTDEYTADGWEKTTSGHNSQCWNFSCFICGTQKEEFWMIYQSLFFTMVVYGDFQASNIQTHDKNITNSHNTHKAKFQVFWSRGVTIYQIFYYMIIVAKGIHDKDVLRYLTKSWKKKFHCRNIPYTEILYIYSIQ